MFTSLSDFGAHLHSRLAAFGDTGSCDSFDDSGFDRLSRSLFRLQFEANPAYRAWSESRGITPETLSSWKQIPLVPTAAFKELDLSCLESGDASRCFHSSGTTGHTPSRNWHCTESLAVYEESAAQWFAPHLLKEADADGDLGSRESDGRWPILSLTPPL